MRTRLLALATMFLLATAGLVRASVVAAYDLETLVERSELGVVGRVVEARSHYEGASIVTDVAVEVAEVGHGRAHRGQRVVLVVPGGSVDGVTMRVEGSVRPAVGAEAFFFLQRHRSGRLVPTGMSQGVLPVDRGGGRARVLPGAAGLALVRPDAGGRMVPARPAVAEPMDLEAFLARVRDVAGGR